MTPIWQIAPGSRPSIVDLSHNNAGFDSVEEFQKLKEDGIGLVLHKATQGSGFVDPKYEARRRLAADAKLTFDAYHFATADPIEAQRAHFLAVAAPDAGMRLMVDAEPNRGSTIRPADAAALVVALDRARGRQVVGYGGAGFADYALSDWHDRPLMWAKFGPEPTVELLTSLGVPPTNVVIWQQTGSGAIEGAYPVDLSYYRFQAAGALQLWPAILGFDIAA